MSRIAESAGAITIAGPANVFQHRLQEAQAALDGIRPFGVFDEEPAPGFARGVRHIEKPDLGLQHIRDFPVTVIEDRAETEHPIAILAPRPLANVLFARRHLSRIADRLACEDHRIRDNGAGTTVTPFERRCIVFYSYHLPVLPHFGGAVNIHTGRHTRLGFQLEASTTMLADPFALVRMAVALEPDIADVLSQRKP